MKKMTWVFVVMMLVVSSAHAEKPAIYNMLTNLHGNIKFNVPTSSDTYIPMVINIDGTARDDLGGRRSVSIIKEVGEETEVKLEGKNLHDALPLWAQPLLKNLYLSAIGDDISQ